MRVVFAGTPQFALTALRQLHAAGFEIVLVLTQPDRPAGRGMKLQASPVKAFALQQDMKLLQPQGLGKNFPQEVATLREAMHSARADVMVVAAYGLLLPPWLLELPRWGCMNIHASLLPRWRGAAPIQRAIEAGDEETGISIMQMDAGLDTGDILLAEKIAILGSDSCASLHNKLAALGGRLMVEALQRCASERLPRAAQSALGVSYAPKIEKREAPIAWRSTALQILRRVRAFDPFPGASACFGAETVKVWAAAPSGLRQAPETRPGSVIAVDPDGIVVATLDTPVQLTQLQRAGGRRLQAAEFLRGFDVAVGTQLES